MNEAGSRYELIGELGRGGMGVVYRARDRLLGRAVALKFLPEDLSADAPQRALFRREARAAAQLSHPGIVTVYDVGRHGGREFIAMELVDGRSLEQLLEEYGHLPISNVLAVMDAVLDAVMFAHAHGIIHRDLKPANIMTLHNGAIKVMDFGLAKLTGASAGAKPTFIAGTPAYMPPEQLRGATDYRADVFALAAMFYELLTGVIPGTESEYAYTARAYESPRELVEAIPADLSSTIMAALSHDPDERPGLEEIAALVKRHRNSANS